MKDYYQNIISSIYSILPKILSLWGILVFYLFLCDGISERATKNELARVLKKEIIQNSANYPIDSISLKQLYNCLNDAQFYNLINSTLADSFNYHSFAFDNRNKELLKRFNITHKGLLKNVITDTDSLGNIKSISPYYLLLYSYKAFDAEVEAKYYQDQISFNQTNVSSIEIPYIKFSLPKTFIPNILIIFIIVQLIKLFHSLNSINFSLKKAKPISEELRTLIVFYKKQYLPFLNQIIFFYFIVLSLSLVLTITLSVKGMLFYEPEFHISDSFNTAHKILGWLNLIVTSVLTIWLYFKLNATRIEINKIS